MAQFQMSLDASELKIVLAALSGVEEKLTMRCDMLADEESVSDIANELVEIRLLLKPLKEKAVKTFGKGILDFS